MDPISFVAAFTLSQKPNPPPVKAIPPVVQPAQEEPYVPRPLPENIPQNHQDLPQNHQDILPQKPQDVPDKPQYIFPPKPQDIPKKSEPIKLVPTERRTQAPITPVWRLEDQLGYVWTSPDREGLQRYVAARNAALAQPAILYSTPFNACSRGRCCR